MTAQHISSPTQHCLSTSLHRYVPTLTHHVPAATFVPMTSLLKIELVARILCYIRCYQLQTTVSVASRPARWAVTSVLPVLTKPCSCWTETATVDVTSGLYRSYNARCELTVNSNGKGLSSAYYTIYLTNFLPEIFECHLRGTLH